VVHDLVECRAFRCASPVVLEVLRCFLPRVAPEHAGLFGESRIWAALELGRLRIGIPASFQGAVHISDRMCCMGMSRRWIYIDGGVTWRGKPKMERGLEEVRFQR
jgi:hypothetical protein